ncbi:MAG: thioredoxin [Bacteroidota bacterium]
MDFQQTVIERSREVPVLVDFWAEWCGPCKVLGPVVEELASEAKGKWELMKVNTEEEQGLAKAYGIYSIPNVKLFHNGEVIAEFRGALPKPSIQKWLDEHLPDPIADLIQNQASSLFDQGNFQEAKARLFELESSHAERHDLQLWLAFSEVTNAPSSASSRLDSLAVNAKQLHQTQSIRDLIELAELSGEKLAQSKAAAPLSQARQAIGEYDFDTVLEQLIQAVIIDKGFEKELPRRAAVTLFQLMGPENPLTKKHRRIFDMALY